MRFTVSVATAILALPAVLAIPNGAAVTVTKTKVITKTKTDIITRTKVETVMRTVYETCLTSASTPVSNTTSGASSSVPITTTSSVNTEEYPTSTAVATATGTQGLNDYAPKLPFVYTEPERGDFNYTGGDVILDIAEANGQVVRCHNLVWYNQLPDWLTSQTWDNATLISIMTDHITNLVSHWGARCYAWDVVNEAINDNGTLRSDFWLDSIGPAYLPIAYAAAAAAAPPSVKLYYNDYNIESPGPKATRAQQLISDIKSQGIRIDGAGLQSHFIVGETPDQASQEANMAAFAALDVDVAVTELDVRSPTLPATVAQQNQQKTDYYSTVAACVNTACCVGITLWDFDDEYSWIPGVFAGQGYADVWFPAKGTDTLVRKEAYDGIVDALMRVALS